MLSDELVPSAPRWRSITVIWGCIGLFDGTQTVVSMRAMGMHHAWVALFVFQLLGWLPWALATPAVMRLGVRVPLRLRRQRGAGGARAALRAWGLHAASWFALSVAASAWVAVTEHLLNPWNPMQAPRPLAELFLEHAYSWILASLFVYYCIVVAGRALDAGERLAAQRMASAELARQLAQAQLAALRHQVEPHFLFNALNAIAGLVREQRNELAVETIARVSEFLRHALDDASTPEVPLDEELRFAEMYLDIQQLRFGERLSLRLDVAPALRGALVPRLVLQPLIENAIKHGIARRAQPGLVALSVARGDAGLVISLYNDGPGLARGAASGDGGRGGAIGLGNVRDRLRGLYGEAASLDIADVEGRGVLVTIRQPWREAAQACAA